MKFKSFFRTSSSPTNNKMYYVVLLFALLTAVNAIFSESPIRQHHNIAESILKRHIPSQTAPSGWKLSWTSTKRLSIGKSKHFISLSTIDKTATSITQTHIDQCVQQCAMTLKCGFVNVVKLNESSLGNVACLLYPQYQNSHDAKYSSSPRKSGGNVQYSYGIRSQCTPVTGEALMCTPKRVQIVSKSTSKTSTRISISSTKMISSRTSSSKMTSSRSTSSLMRTTSSSRMTSVPVSSSSTSTTTTTSSTSTTPFVPPPTSFSQPFYVRQNSQYPPLPQGATLIQWSPCQNSKLTNPAMANKPFIDGSSASIAYIVQHGAGSDFDNYFSYLYEIIGQTGPIISPGFMTNDNSSKYYLGDMNMAFDAKGDSWVAGENDVTGAFCSSFDQHDAIIRYYSNSIKFPKLQKIVLIGHSGGGNFLSRYSTVTNAMPVEMRYVIVNAANEAYYDKIRPDLNATSSTCTPAYNYPYQWGTGKGNQYVNARMSDSLSRMFKQWIGRNVYHLTGDQDTLTTGTQMCQSLVQGGPYRRDRNYAYWAYLNLLAGTNTDVSAFHGYQAFKDQNITPISNSNGAFNHRQCTVAGVGHNAALMFQSDCGRAAILGNAMPAGAGASYPSPIASPSPSPSSGNSTTNGDH